MSLQELALAKAWVQRHKATRPLEFHAWDAVLTLWLMGWVGVPSALLAFQPWAILPCVAAFFAPSGYVAWRRRLHRQGRLRCDWLQAFAAGQAP